MEHIEYQGLLISKFLSSVATCVRVESVGIRVQEADM